MNLRSKELTMCAMFAALIALGAFIRIDIPMPLYTMHFTLQLFFVLSAGFILGARGGALSVLVYLCLGLIGFPVFAAGGGPAYVLRAGFGFLLGFIPTAYIAGTSGANLFWKMLGSAVIGLAVDYLAGTLYFYLIMRLYVSENISLGTIAAQYCLITVLPDLVLCILASFVSFRLRPQLKAVMGQ
ncbi:MAG: biotin transporter BioY [Eubacteriales bacterium]|nr:biotin transporter BioY [Eubacteriales bacterium]